MHKKTWLPVVLFFICITQGVFAQYPGPAGSPGSTALFKDTNLFIAWATSCSLIRGYQNISDTTFGISNVGNVESAIGKAGETGGVVSLGDGGMAILTFAKPITNGPGADFAVFENAFADEFLELAFVEVSSDGQHFVRFPAVSLTQTSKQIGPFDYVGRAGLLHNLAGKYRLFYGTPFDLEELKDSSGIRIDSITHIRIIDVVGSILPAFARKDSRGNIINDPFPTTFPSGGFDLDGIGVIHEKQPRDNKEETGNEQAKGIIYPSPALDYLIVKKTGLETKWQILNGLGQVVMNGQKTKDEIETTISVANLKAGCYYFKMEQADVAQNTIRFFKF